jgi:hypothetical protein
MPRRYIITRHAHLEGVRLSMPGHWGNLPFEDDAAAVSYATRDAGGPPSIERPPARHLRSGSL